MAKNNKSNAKDIRVSVLCSTYNHANYIKQALDGFINQKTNFDFEVLINDDSSTDGTVEIIKDYAKKYPKIIKPNLQKENLYSKGYRNMMMRSLFPKAKGKYIALCEGDDYWTDSNKLQKQVDFLEKHKDYALCFHPVRVFFENSEKKEYVYPDFNSSFDLEKLLKTNFIHTNSVMYRKVDYKNFPLGVFPGDWYLHLYHAQFGKIGFINKTMAAYRRHPQGIWWNSHENKDEFWKKYYLYHLDFCKEILKMYGNNAKLIKIIRELIRDFFTSILDVDKRQNTDLLNSSIKKYPDLAAYFAADIEEEKKNAISLLRKQESENSKLIEQIKAKDTELHLIKYSRVWRLRNHITRIKGKIKQ